jgi:hypothetical protein
MLIKIRILAAHLCAHSCTICGSNVMTTNEGSESVQGKVVLASGCLDGDACVEFRPERKVYCKDKCGWVEVGAETEKAEGMV